MYKEGRKEVFRIGLELERYFYLSIQWRAMGRCLFYKFTFRTLVFYFYLGGVFKDCYYDYFYINSDRIKKGFTFSVSF